MGKAVDKLLNAPIYIYLIGVFYLVFKISLVPFTFSALTAVEFLVGYVLLSYLIILAFNKLGFKQITLVLAFFWVSFLFHQQIVDFSANVLGTENIRYKYVWLSEIFITTLFVFLSNKINRYNGTLNKIANSWVAIATGIFIINICYSVITFKSTLQADYENHVSVKSTTKQRPSIIWLLFDEYSNSDYIKSRFNYNNPLDSILKQKGFHVFSDIRSRSDYTLYSINSIFNFDDPTIPYTFDYGLYALKNSALPKVLKQLGYHFTSYTIFDIGDNIIAQKPPYYTPTLLFKLIEGTVIQIYMQFHMINLYMKLWLPPNNSKHTRTRKSDRNDDVVKSLQQLLKEKNDQRYVFAHFILPHDPFVKFKYGHKYYAPPNDRDTTGLKEGYIGNIKYANDIISDLWNGYPALKESIIIISGDHGVRFRFLTNNKDNHRLRPFCAVYLPPGIDSTGLSKINYISQLPAFALSAKEKSKN